MTMLKSPRIRDLYQQYLEGGLPFEELMAAADAYLERFEAEHPLEPEPRDPA